MSVDEPKKLSKLSLEELMDIKVTSVSKKEENLFGAAAAIHVITAEDIRRSGATHIPDLLRQVPGMQVAQFAANTWAVSSRGFNSRFASKLLVLIDGRSVYTPLFSGVFWDDIDTRLEDIERIEVIRGPGGTLWGANAVNGVINIITKNTKDTLGAEVVAGAGNEEQGFGSFRYGQKIGEKANIRVYGKYLSRDELKLNSGNDGADDWEQYRGGFRVDWDYSTQNSLMVQGDYYNGQAGGKIKNQVIALTTPFTRSLNDVVKKDGASFLARWNRKVSSDSDIQLQLYFNREQRRGETAPKILDNTYDLDFQHRFAFNTQHEITWGLEQRFVEDSLVGTLAANYDSLNRLHHRSGIFIQDKVTIVPEKLLLTLGSKMEVNSYSGFEIQPGARLAWTPNDRNTLWGAISRAVRTPSRVEDTARLNVSVSTGPVLSSQFGNQDYESEDLIAFEMGYRVKPRENLSFDIATFYNQYDNLITKEIGTPVVETDPSPSHTLIPITVENQGNGETYGVEISSNWNIRSWWKMTSSFTWFKINLSRDVGSNANGFESTAGNDPEFQWQLHSHWNLSQHFEFDSFFYYVDSLDSLDVEEYTRLDLRLGWNPIENLELSIIGQNLLDPDHTEFATETLATGTATNPERSIFGKVLWKF